MLVDVGVFGLRQDYRSGNGPGADSGDEFVKGVSLADKKERAAPSTGQVAHSGFFSSRPLDRDWQTLNHQRIQVVLQHHVFEVTVQLDNRRVGAPNRSELSRMLCQQDVVK